MAETVAHNVQKVGATKKVTFPEERLLLLAQDMLLANNSIQAMNQTFWTRLQKLTPHPCVSTQIPRHINLTDRLRLPVHL